MDGEWGLVWVFLISGVLGVVGYLAVQAAFRLLAWALRWLA